MRSEMWRWLDATFASGSRLIDIGCGTGLDAVRMARRGHCITATDWSPRMLERTADRVAAQHLQDRVAVAALGGHELCALDEPGVYDGAYSNLGAVNCVPDPGELSHQCARLLKPGGALVFTVIGRICPWEIVHYARQRRWARIKVRFSRGPIAVGLNKHTVWTRYYGPREFYRAFEREFRLEHHRALCLFAPPPYLTSVRDSHSRWYDRLWRIDRRVSGLPILRAMGDHFLIVLRKR
ncbi:MAG: methylase involved in ubiquinone/menaquinone biosynthesis [Gammaproteobacteria bacterium]|nr:methylase involved in ubiquinone/menaquinone biosynthesis [Gammaproteobacteria bacterium]